MENLEENDDLSHRESKQVVALRERYVLIERLLLLILLQFSHFVVAQVSRVSSLPTIGSLVE